MQYAFDGQHIEGQSQNSAFTKHLIDGLVTGNADTDNDGLVDIDKLYQYTYRKIVPQQTPNISSTAQEGRMFVGLNPNPTFHAVALPSHIQEAMQSEIRLHRQGAISELTRLLKSEDPSMVFSAENALRNMVNNDDSKSVADLARESLEQYHKKSVDEQKKQVQVPALPKSDGLNRIPVETGQSNVVPVIIDQKANSVPQMPRKQENLAGVFNILLPGASYALKGQWRAAIITFVIASVLSLSLIYLIFALEGSCFIPFELILFAYLFFQGRNIGMGQKNRKVSLTLSGFLSKTEECEWVSNVRSTG
jgi:hypothetical protein